MSAVDQEGTGADLPATAGQFERGVACGVGRIEGYVREHPLAAGAMALGIGAVVGLAVPLSKRENELMGEARDSLLESAHAVAEEAVERAQRVAERTVEAATEEGLLL
jgi:hypothetical protein